MCFKSNESGVRLEIHIKKIISILKYPFKNKYLQQHESHELKQTKLIISKFFSQKCKVGNFFPGLFFSQLLPIFKAIYFDSRLEGAKLLMILLMHCPL